jgi:hypothetical protein
MHASFEVGTEERHLVEIDWSMGGAESYRVDGIEVLSVQSKALRGTRQFAVGDREPHQVTIVVDMLPSWKTLFWNGGFKDQVFVDGELHVRELFPEQHRSNERLFRGLHVLMGVVVVLAFLHGFLLVFLAYLPR